MCEANKNALKAAFKTDWDNPKMLARIMHEPESFPWYKDSGLNEFFANISDRFNTVGIENDICKNARRPYLKKSLIIHIIIFAFWLFCLFWFTSRYYKIINEFDIKTSCNIFIVFFAYFNNFFKKWMKWLLVPLLITSFVIISIKSKDPEFLDLWLGFYCLTIIVKRVIMQLFKPRYGVDTQIFIYKLKEYIESKCLDADIYDKSVVIAIYEQLFRLIENKIPLNKKSQKIPIYIEVALNAMLLCVGLYLISSAFQSIENMFISGVYMYFVVFGGIMPFLYAISMVRGLREILNHVMLSYIMFVTGIIMVALTCLLCLLILLLLILVVEMLDSIKDGVSKNWKKMLLAGLFLKAMESDKKTNREY